MSTPSGTGRAASGAGERERALVAWRARRRFDGARYEADRLLELKRQSVSVVLPAREVAGTIESVVAALAPLERAGLVDELVVVDAASTDGTAHLAAARGATVLQESALVADLGPARGKGDAMWRGLAATRGDLVAFLDTDTEDFSARFLLGLLGPLLEHPEIELVKGAFRRPFKGAGDEADGGGRVTELVARPLLNLYLPQLAGFFQPLAGEVAARRALLESLPFPVGYGVEIAMLIDAARAVGLDAMAESDLGTRQNRHQPLRALGPMAYAVLVAALRRIHGQEHLEALGPGPMALAGLDRIESRNVPVEERPPLRSRSEGGPG